MRKSGAPSFRQLGNIRDSTNSPSSSTNQAFKAVAFPNASRNTACVLDLLTSISSEADDAIDSHVESIENHSTASIPESQDKARFIEPLRDRQVTSNVSEKIGDTGEKTVFTVVFGKQTTKKHKTYESDGTLEVVGKNVLLKDSCGRVVGRSTIKAPLSEGNVLNVGSKAVQIGELFTGTVVTRPPSPEKPRFHVAKKPRRWNSLAMPLPEVNTRGFQMDYEPLVMPQPSHEQQWRDNESRLPLTPVSVDPCLARVLRAHQRAGVVFLYRCLMGMNKDDQRGAILADEMGLGKTLQCITVIWLLLKQGPYGGRPVVRRVLVVTPSSLVANWNKEFVQWLGRERIQTFVVDQKNKPKDFARLDRIPIMMISYEMFVRYFDQITTINFDLLICDEGHRLKNTAIRTSSLLTQLNCKRRVLLTGTPIQNDLQELFALVDFVNPGALGSAASFRRHFEAPIVASRQPDVSTAYREIGEQRATELAQITKAFILRRTQQVIDKYLPSKQESVVFCRPTPLQCAMYASAVSFWHDRVNKPGAGVAHLGVITALKKICNHPALIQAKASAEQTQHKASSSSALHLENIPVSESLISHLLTSLTSPDAVLFSQSGKLSVVIALLDQLSHTSEKVVLVSYFTQTLDMFASLCDEKKYKYCRLDGSTPTNQRLDIVNKFNGPYSQHTVFLLSARAGGVGLNLVGASRLVLYDSDWNPASDLQAMARVWRDGQRRPVHMYRLLTAATIEEKVYQRQISKQGISGAIVDPGNDSAVRLSTEQLKDLFSFTPEKSCLTHDILDCPCAGDGSIPGGPEDEPEVPEEEFSTQRACQLAEVAEEKQSLRMNQLYKWQHHAAPFSPAVMQEMGLSTATDFMTYMFRNSSH